jgi:UDP-glucose 4-epimerase
MKKILVTGGEGFIGTNLVKRLVNKGFEVSVFDKKSGKDILDYQLLEESIKWADIVIHLAAIVSIQETIKNPIESRKINVDATKKIFELCVKHNIEKVIYASSAAVYGDNADLSLSENSVTKPISPYGEHKLQNEKDAKEFSSAETSFVGFRFFNVYGPYQNLKSDYSAVIPLFIKKFINNDNLKIFGDGEQTRDFIYVEDLVEALILAINDNKKRNEVFNLGSGEKISINNLVKNLSEIFNKKIEVLYENSKEGDIKHSFSDISKIKKELNFSPKFNFELGLQKTIDYLKNTSN